MKDRVILDLCAGTGAWSQPYVDAGYDVRRIELKHGQDVRLLYKAVDRVHGILAAPPCTYFCRMRMCRGRPTPEQFREGLSVVDACLRAVVVHRPAWWALENPQGYLKQWLGAPVLKFDPCDYGDPWTKNTWIWGSFARPVPSALRALPRGGWIVAKRGRRKESVSGGDKNNAVTPPGFAQAFFSSNP